MQYVILETVTSQGRDVRAQEKVRRRGTGYRTAVEPRHVALDAGEIEYVVSRPEGGAECILNRAHIEAAEILAALGLVG